LKFWGRSLGRRRRRNGRRLTQRKQRHRIDVAARIVRSADAEVDIGLADFGVSRRSDGPDRLALGDSVANGDGDRAQMREGDGPAVIGPHRNGLAVRRE